MRISLRAVALATAVTSAVLPARLAAQAPASPPLAPAAGDVIPAFETLDVQGKPQRVSFARGSTTILLFFLSGCPTCHKMIPEWNRAYERRAKELRVIGVIMDQEPPGFWGTIPIAFPVLRSPGRQFLTGLNINRAPLTLRVAGGGRVEDVGLGALDPIRLGELFRP